MQRAVFFWAIYILFIAFPAEGESFRTLVMGGLTLSAENPTGSSIRLGYNSSALIQLDRDARFFRGIELELSAPQAWLLYQGSLAMLVYSGLNRTPSTGVNDLVGRRVIFEPLPNRLSNVYQVPVRSAHGLRASPYARVFTDITPPSSFPVLFKLTPIIKGMSDELENMQFLLTARPILSDEGAVNLRFRYPQQLRGRPYVVLINDVQLENINEEQLLRAGEHHLVVLSDDYRNESRRFIVERARVLELVIDLQDPAPLLVFEAPENARITLNNSPVSRGSGPVPVDPGVHEVRFQIGDYSITRTISVQRGKTYRVAMAVDIEIHESD